jgi:hypothetical protein
MNIRPTWASTEFTGRNRGNLLAPPPSSRAGEPELRNPRIDPKDLPDRNSSRAGRPASGQGWFCHIASDPTEPSPESALSRIPTARPICGGRHLSVFMKMAIYLFNFQDPLPSQSSLVWKLHRSNRLPGDHGSRWLAASTGSSAFHGPRRIGVRRSLRAGQRLTKSPRSSLQM